MRLTCTYVNTSTPGVTVTLPNPVSLTAFEHTGIPPPFVGRGVATCSTGNADQYVSVLALNFIGISGFSTIPVQ